MPVDVVDFIVHWPAVRHDLPLTLAIALLKEPTAKAAMRTTVSAATRDAMNAAPA